MDIWRWSGHWIEWIFCYISATTRPKLILYLILSSLLPYVATLPSHTAPSLPGRDDKEVHDVPHVPHVAVFVEDEAHREDPRAHLHREYDHEDGLELLLQRVKQIRFKSCSYSCAPPASRAVS